jgi:hypothetical protein
MNGALYIPSGLVVYLVVIGLLQATAHAKAIRNGDVLVFGPTLAVRVLLIALIIAFACATVYVSLTPPPSLSGAGIFGLITVVGTMAFPSDVLVSRTGVAQVRWWGAKTAIPWKDVSRIEYHKGPATTVVVSRAGLKVVHSGWNRDTKGFLQSCEERSGLSATTSEI